MLLPLVTEKIVATREAFELTTTRVTTEEGRLGGRLVNMLALVTDEILRVQKPLVARGAPVRPLIAVQVGLLVTPNDAQPKLRDTI